MNDTTLARGLPAARPRDAAPRASAGGLIREHKSRTTVVAVLVGIVCCLAYAAFSLHHDVTASGEPAHALCRGCCSASRC